MVDFTLTDEQKALREMAHDFAEREIRPVAWHYDRDGTWPAEILRKAWELGVMNGEGRVLAAKYDKFRQINRFLEMVDDVAPHLAEGRKLHIIDFGCGKSYVTFALYHYLTQVRGLDIEVTGLDLKADVIAQCEAHATEDGEPKLELLKPLRDDIRIVLDQDAARRLPAG